MPYRGSAPSRRLHSYRFARGTGMGPPNTSAYSGERDRQFRRNVTVAHGWVLRGSDCRRGGHDELFFSSYFRVFRSVTA
jgi:hypothetical protein